MRDKNNLILLIIWSLKKKISRKFKQNLQKLNIS